MNCFQPSNGGRRKCKYYKACGSTDNCKRCNSFEKENKKCLAKVTQ